MDVKQRLPSRLRDIGQKNEENLLKNTIAEHIDEHVSIHDTEFDRGVEMYGDEYVQEYITSVSEYMAGQIVSAYAAHDLKQYEDIATHFTEVYRFLFPVSELEADKAGNGDAYALVEHDVLDEGVDIIRKHYTLYDYVDDVLTLYDDIRYSDEQLTTEEFRENSGWDRVKQGYEIVQNALDLPIGAFFDDYIVGPYARERTLAFKHHTAAKESCDQGSEANQESERLMRKYMKRAEISKFSTLVDDFDLLDDLSDLFLKAVEEHDRGTHGPDEWQKNVKNMSIFYGTLLSEMVADRYDSPAVEDMRNGYRNRLSEAVSG